MIPKPRKEELGNDSDGFFFFTANSHYSRTSSVIPSRLLPAQTTRGHGEGRGGRRASCTRGKSGKKREKKGVEDAVNGGRKKGQVEREFQGVIL